MLLHFVSRMVFLSSITRSTGIFARLNVKICKWAVNEKAAVHT